MKKTVAIVLLVCLTTLLLTACGNTPAIKNTPSIETSMVEKNAVPEPTQSPTIVPETSESTLGEGKVIVSTFAELQTAVENQDIAEIYVNSAIDTTSELSFERNDDLTIHIEHEGTLTISELFEAVGCSIINDGTISISKTFNRGITNLINNGTITVKSGGKVSSGMSNTENHGNFSVDAGGELFIERGSIFNNFDNLTNNGSISINDGGQLNDEGGTIINNGIIDLYSFFNGDIANITGTGTLNDNRE